MKKKIPLSVALVTAALTNCPAQNAAASALDQLNGVAIKSDISFPGVPVMKGTEELFTPVPFEELSPATKDLLLNNEGERSLTGIIGTIGTLVSIGNTIINVIRGGEIVYNNGYAAVYPKDADWRYFTWKKQSVYSFRYKKTTAGITVVDSVIAVSFKYDGQYNGSGRYIGNIQVVGDKCSTLLSNKLTVTAELPPSSVENLAPATPLDPLASIALNLTYANQALVGSISKREAHQIRGDGKLIDSVTGMEPKWAAVTHINLR